MNSAADVVRAAQAEKTEIGGRYLSNSRSGNKYCSWYGMDGYWCAMFVSYVMSKAGVPTNVVPKYSWCQNCIDFAKSQGRLYSKSQITSGAYTPSPGDIFFRSGDHTGIIVSVSGGSFTTIEGNTGGGGSGKRTVASHTWTFSGGSYTHVFHPKYSGGGSYSSQSAMIGGSKTYAYSANSYSEVNKEPTVTWNKRSKENISAVLNSADDANITGNLTLYANGNDITKYAGNLSWKNSIYELSTTMSFETPKTDTPYLKDLIYVPSIGDVVQLVTDKEVFRGIVIKLDDGNRNTNKYDAADMGCYLNKTAQTYQFKSIAAKTAITEICSDLSIPIDTIPELTAVIKEIYWDKNISDIIKDILSKCGGYYNYDFTPKGLRIYKIGDLKANPEFTVASNIPAANSVDYKGSVSHSTSIENMKNSVKITSEKDRAYSEIMVLQNRELIDKYGFLQEIVKIDTEKENAQTVAQSELAELSKPTESYSFEIIEDMNSYTRAGEVIEDNGVSYVIESTDHSIKNGWHFNKMEVRRL